MRTTSAASAGASGSPEQLRHLCRQFIDGAVDRSLFLERCVQLTNALIGCSRTGVWVFVDTKDGRSLQCLAMFDAVANRMTRVPDERRGLQPYFEELERNGFVRASDASLHPATRDVIRPNLGSREVRSLLASGFAVNGGLFGAFTCTQLGERQEWTPRQLSALRKVGVEASLALYATCRTSPSTGYGPLA